jgi:CRP/FNR family transcriptional regulator, cyclic AMP receptor protein
MQDLFLDVFRAMCNPGEANQPMATDSRKKQWHSFGKSAIILPVKSLLCDVPIFTGINEKALEVFLAPAKQIVVPAGEIIAREGDKNDCLYLIEAGEVCIYKNIDTQNPVTLAVLGPGECFGEMCVLEALPRCATAKAVGQVTVVSVPSDAFSKLYQKAPEQYCIILLNIARDLSRRLRHLGDTYAARL